MRKSSAMPIQWLFSCVALTGLLLTASGTAAWAKSASKGSQSEAAACKLINFIPEPGPGAWEAISVRKSTLSALLKTGNRSFESVVRAYDKAANAQNGHAMIRAIDNGVKVCHRLGLKTAS